MKNQVKKSGPITYSCYYHSSRDGEQFIPEHVVSFQISGTIKMTDGEKEYVFTEGSFRLSRRNTLIRFKKDPRPGGEYKNISVILDQQMLKSFSLEYGITGQPSAVTDRFIKLEGGTMLKSYFESIKPYASMSSADSSMLASIKIKEGLAILLQNNPGIRDILFDFTEPGKIDLEAFMRKNFMFNVSLERFAYLTGRSLATFKRDFEKLFHTSPSRWLQQQRLQQAYHLIREKGRRPSDVYIEVGFENLSHFSFAFKKAYGVPPSLLT